MMTAREDTHNHRISNMIRNHLLLTNSFQYSSEKHRNKIKCDNEKNIFGQKSTTICRNIATYSENDIAMFMCVSAIHLSSSYI